MNDVSKGLAEINNYFDVKIKMLNDGRQREIDQLQIMGQVAFIDKSTSEAYQEYLALCREARKPSMSKIEFSRSVVRWFGLEIIDLKIEGKKYRVFVEKSQ